MHGILSAVFNSQKVKGMLMSPYRSPKVLLALLLLMGVVLFMSGSTSVQAAPPHPTARHACEEPQDVYVYAHRVTLLAEAHWTKCHNAGWTQIIGWVEDSEADGRCAEVYAVFTNGIIRPLAKACPKGTKAKFQWNEPASDASVYLRLV